jgi:hypothetical protein
MGKQIQFHALPEDMHLLLEHIRERDPVIVTHKSAQSPAVAPVSDPLVDYRGTDALEQKPTQVIGEKTGAPSRWG